MQPFVRHKAEDQVAHQFRRREEEFVAAVVFVGHRRILPAVQVLGMVALQKLSLAPFYSLVFGCHRRILPGVQAPWRDGLANNSSEIVPGPFFFTTSDYSNAASRC